MRSEADAQHLAQFLVNHRDKAGGNTLFLIMQSMTGIGWLREVGANKGSAVGFCSEIEQWVVVG